MIYTVLFSVGTLALITLTAWVAEKSCNRWWGAAAILVCVLGTAACLIAAAVSLLVMLEVSP